MTNRVADAYDGRKPQSLVDEENNMKTFSPMSESSSSIFDAYRNNPATTVRNVAAVVMYTVVVLCIGALAFSPPEGKEMTSRGASRFSDGITKVWTSDLMGNRFAGRARGKERMLARPRAAHAERGIFQTARSGQAVTARIHER